MKKILFVILVLIIAFSCKQECSPNYYKTFTDNDLSFVLINNNDINQTSPINYSKIDTIVYLLNSTDTIYAKRDISVENILVKNYKTDCLNRYYIQGEFKLEFIDSCFIKNSFIKIVRDDNCSELHRYIQVDYDDEDINNNCFNNTCDLYCIKDVEIRKRTINGIEYDSFYFKTDSNSFYFIQNIGLIEFYDKDQDNLLQLIEY